MMQDTESYDPALDDEDEIEITVASKTSRLIAFMLDILLIGTFTILVTFGIIVPKFYPAAFTEAQKSYSEFVANPEMTSQEYVESLPPRSLDMLQTITAFATFSIWFYFALSEILMRGSTLGKRVVSIQTVSTRTLFSPGYVDTFLRAGIKTLTLFVYPPFLLISFILIYFTRKNQTGHDILTRTLVIERNPNLIQLQAEDIEDEEDPDDFEDDDDDYDYEDDEEDYDNGRR